MFTVSELFDLAAQVEVNGERFYRTALRKVKPDSLKNLFGWLADEELKHKMELTETKERITGGIEPDRSRSLSSLLRDAMGAHVFSLDELQIDSIRDEEEILQAALVFEEDTIRFFEFIGSFISDPDAFSTLERIKAEESNHKQLLIERIYEMGKKPVIRES